MQVLHLPKPDEESQAIAVVLEPIPRDAKPDSAVRMLPYHVHATIGSRRVAVFDNAAKKVRRPVPFLLQGR